MSPAKPKPKEPQRRNRKSRVRQHWQGHWFIRDKGRDIYLGTDLAAAVAKAAQLLPPERFDPKSVPISHRGKIAGARWARRVAAGFKAPPLVELKGRTVSDAAERLYAKVEAESGKAAWVEIRKNLGPFVEAFGERRVDGVNGEALESYRLGLHERYSEKTINHKLAAVRRLLGYIYDPLGWVDHPYRLGSLEAVALPPTPDKSLSAERVAEIVSNVSLVNPNLARMLLLQFWTCARLSEIPKMVHGEGVFERRWPYVFRLAKGKTDKATGSPTWIVLTDPARELLKSIQPMYPDQWSLNTVVRDVVVPALKAPPFNLKPKVAEFTPGPLRHSAATLLIDNGVEDELVETALHHAVPRVKGTYRPGPFERTRDAMMVLTELVPLSTIRTK